MVLGEHRGSEKLTIWVNDGSGNLTELVVGSGKENHLGAQTVDLDGDGDLDIVGIAWDAYYYVHLWRNDNTVEAPSNNSVTLTKESLPEGMTDFSFTGDLGDFTLDDGGSITFNDLSSGEYLVTEVVADGWNLTNVSCSGAQFTQVDNGVSLELTQGDAVNCTFTNEQSNSITISKESDPDTEQSFVFGGDLGEFNLQNGISEDLLGSSRGRIPDH